MRLTNKIKEDTLKKAIIKNFKKPVDKLRNEFKDLAREAVYKSIAPEVRRWMNKKPKDVNCFTSVNSIILKSETDVLFHNYLLNNDYLFNLNKEIMYTSEKNIVLSSSVVIIDSYLRFVLLEDSNHLLEKINNILNQFDKIEKEQREFESIINGALNSCTTVAKLKETYPDITLVLPKSKKKLPAVLNTQVTCALNKLPSVK